MLFNSLDFLLFFPAVCLISLALRSLCVRNLFLLVDVVERWLRDAARKSGDKWIVLMTHSGKDDFSLDDLESFVKCAKSLGCEFMTASAAAETWRNRGWEPSARPAVEHSRADEIADLVRFHWLYVLGMAICGTVILAALILILRRIKMI